MTISFRELSTKFLAWSKLHQAPRSYEYYEGYIRKFIVFLNEQSPDVVYKPAEEMKPYHIKEWVDSHPKWSDNYKRGGVVAINRVYNWATKNGYITNNPIRTPKRISILARMTNS